MHSKSIYKFINDENNNVIRTKILKDWLQSEFKLDYLSLNTSMQKSSLTNINNRH